MYRCWLRVTRQPAHTSARRKAGAQRGRARNRPRSVQYEAVHFPFPVRYQTCVFFLGLLKSSLKN